MSMIENARHRLANLTQKAYSAKEMGVEEERCPIDLNESSICISRQVYSRSSFSSAIIH